MHDISHPVFVTGATGSIGSMLVRRLIQDGRPVRALVRNPLGAEHLRRLGNIEVVHGDLAEPQSLRGCMEACSIVYHCAAKLAGSDWDAFRAANVDGTRALLNEAARAAVQRFVHLSTIGVYACSQAQDIGEDFPWPDTNYPYFATKQAAERAVQQAAERLPVVIARVGDVMGPGQQTWTINFIEKIRQGLLQPPTEREGGTFNPVFIDNLIDALLLLGTHPRALGQAFNIVDGTPIPFCDYIRRLAVMAGRRTFPLPGWVLRTAAGALAVSDLLRGREAMVKPGDIDYLLHKATISGRKIDAMLGWKPCVNQADAFLATEAWLRDEGYLS